MDLQALDEIRLDRSWARLLTWARKSIADVPDRLPFELAQRMWGDVPRLDPNHEPQALHLVMATKAGSQTVRPFARPHVRDSLLYQALVDALREPVQRALLPETHVMANRLSPLSCDDIFEGSPKWRDFLASVRVALRTHPTAYMVRGDVASFYLSIDHNCLAERLLVSGGSPAVVTDLRNLLTRWGLDRVKGLPQGVPASGPLANAYLSPLDAVLSTAEFGFWRYSDDFVALVPSFGAARRLLDDCERALYALGMTLGGAKTSIKRASRAAEDFISSDEQIEASLRIKIADAGDYGPEETELDELRIEQIYEVFDDAVIALAHDDYRRSALTFALRELGRRRDGHAVNDLVIVLRRLPGLTKEAMSYVCKLRSRDRDRVADALNDIAGWDFHRDQEWLHILRASLHVKGRALAASAPRFATLAAEHDAPLVRSRALLAWGRHSAEDDISHAERFFASERRMWLGYAVAALKSKRPEVRAATYERWRSQGRGIARLIDSIESDPLAWGDM